MKNSLRKILIMLVTVILTLSVQVSVSAIDLGENLNWDAVTDLIGQIFPDTTTTAENPENTTADSETTTADGGENSGNEDSSNAVSSSGSSLAPSNQEEVSASETQPSTVYYPVATTAYDDSNIAVTTTEPAGDEEEDSSLSFDSSLSALLEDDSAAVIIQTPTESYTIEGLIVQNDNKTEDKFTWQIGALIAAAVLFVILLALIAALLIQNSKKKKEEAELNGPYGEGNKNDGAVPVEVMTPERIAELLGSAAGRNVSSGYEGISDFDRMSGEETAAAIKAAALMGQLSHSYSDPILRKYTDEPVMISPSSTPLPDIDAATVADILEATDYMLDDMNPDEKYAKYSDGGESTLATPENININGRICPDCGNDVPVDDVFCHNCGTYIG